MPSKFFRQRLDALFQDFEQLASNPISEAASLRREIEGLRARLLELESEFKHSEPQSQEQTPRRDAPGLYATERVGFAYAGDSVTPLRSPDGEAGAPVDGGVRAALTSSGQIIGKVEVKPSAERTWSAEEASLLESVARQASLQIENLRLLDSAERARAEAESATRQFMHESWDSYMDGIHQSERVGYAYDQSAVVPMIEPPGVDSGITERVNVMEEQVGTLYLQPNPSRPPTHEERAMIAAVARQVAQQVENIRLLAEASRARAEAEEATRQLTRENWEAYATQREDELGFAFDSNTVTRLTQNEPPASVNLHQPLTVRGEVVGRLAASLGTVTPEARELSATIAERVSVQLETLRLTEELQRRAAELMELDRLKSSFLANMSHELRTPLNSILGFSDVMLEELDGPLTPNMQNDLQLIQKNGRHLLHLINDVLDMAKIEAGRMNLNPEPFLVHEVIEDVFSITSALTGDKNLSVLVEADSDREVEITADRTRIRQVLINLVTNAMKFTERGEIRLHVQRRAEHVLIRVRDTGIGIPIDKLESVFQEFTQVDTSTTRKAGGTGLGLPISRRLIAMHSGRLWAESTGVPGEGATFFVELPIEARITESVEIEKVQK